MRDIVNFVIYPVDILLASLSVTFNLLVLLAVIQTRSLQVPPLILLCSLSITDVLWATFTLIRDTVTLTHEYLCLGKIIRGLPFTQTVVCWYPGRGGGAVEISECHFISLVQVHFHP